MAEFYCLIMNIDQHTLCRKWEEKITFFSVPPSETAPNTISLAWCPISTFTLTVPVSRLKAQLLTLPSHNSSRCPLTTPHAALSQHLTLPSHNSHHTIYHNSYNFSPLTSTVQFTAVCSVNSLRSKKLSKPNPELCLSLRSPLQFQ